MRTMPGIGYINPSEFGLMTSIQMVVMVVVGGMASVWGALIGAAAIQPLKTWLITIERMDVRILGMELKGLDPIVFGAVLIVDHDRAAAGGRPRTRRSGRSGLADDQEAKAGRCGEGRLTP